MTNPYTRLRDEYRKWASSIIAPQVFGMFKLEGARTPGKAWRIHDLCERVAAADQIGFHVRLRVDGDDLLVEYVKRAPPPPWEIRP